MDTYCCCRSTKFSLFRFNESIQPKLAPAALREELDRSGYLIHQADGSFNPRISLGAGTTVPSGQARCYELKYEKFFDGKALALVETEEGVMTETQLDG